MKFTSAIGLAIKGISISTLTVALLFFLPFTQSFFDQNKIILLAVGASALILFWGIQTAVTGIAPVISPALTAGFSLLALISLVSTLVMSRDNPVESLIASGGFLGLFSLFLIAAVAIPHMDAGARRILKWVFMGTSGILAVTGIYMFFNIGSLMFPAADYLKDPLWTPTGSPRLTLMILLIALPLAVEELIRSIKSRDDTASTFAGLIVFLIIGGFVAIGAKLLPLLGTSALPFTTSWAAAFEVMKDPARAVVGIGPNNYQTAFTAVRPPSFNLGPFQNIRFSMSGSGMLHLMTIYGIGGLAGIILLTNSLMRNLKMQGSTLGLRISIILSILMFALVPLHASALAVLGIMLLLKPHRTDQVRYLPVPGNAAWLRIGIASVTFMLFLMVGYLTFRFYRGELAFHQSLVAVTNNDGIAAYNGQIRAIDSNPWMTGYHITYSQTNLALANSIALRLQELEASGSADAVDPQAIEQDRQLISQLLQQSIREAKIATQRASRSPAAWENLARIYASITGVVEGADEWAIAAFRQAILLDPTMPSIRLNLAGIHIQREDYESALQELQIALSLKPDSANIYYNLAFVYGQVRQPFRQAVALKQTLDLLTPDSQDAQTVRDQLEDVRKALTPQEQAALDGTTTAPGTDTQQPIATPPVRPEPQVEPPIELPEDASPSAQVGEEETVNVVPEASPTEPPLR